MMDERNASGLYDFTEELLKSDHPVRITVTGNSMYPFLKKGDVVTVTRCSPDKLQTGDIIGFKAENKWVAHRLCKVNVGNGEKTLHTRGDTNMQRDPPIRVENYIGKVISFSRNGKEKGVETRSRRYAGNLIARFPEIFIPLLRLHLWITLQISSVKSTLDRIIEGFLFSIHGSGKLYAANGLIAVAEGVFPLLGIYLLKYLIDLITGIGSSGFKPDSNRLLIWILIVTGIVFLGGSILNITGNLFRERLKQSITRRIYNLLHNRHSNLDFACLEDPDTLDKIYRASQEGTYRPIKFVNESLILAQSIVSILVMAVLIISVHPSLILLLLVALLPGFWIRVRFSIDLYQYKKQSSRKERESHYYHRILTGFSFAKELRLFNLGSFFRPRFEKIQDQLYNEKNNLLKNRALPETAAQSFSVILLFCSIGYVVFLAVEGTVSAGTVVMYILVCQRGFSVLRAIFQSIAGMCEDTIFMKDLFDFMQLPPHNQVSTSDGTPQLLSRGITLENVGFQYPSGKRKALDGISLFIPAHKTVALVGPNGSGKTTIIKLLCAFYKPTEGRILFDDQDISQFSPDGVRKQISAIFQDFALYNLPAAENIGLGNIFTPIDPDGIKRAAILAGIGDLLDKLPLGYDQPLGNLFEKGEELSTGEWQKMAMARAFYRNSPIVFLDEPSSTLDSETESELLQNLRLLARDKTVLIISHRFSTIKWADIIYVLDEGKLVESGTHDQLMLLRGRYHSLYERTSS